MIEPALVIDVRPEDYSVRVVTQTTHRELLAEIPSLYAHSQHSGGVHFMPEVGSTCFVLPLGDSRAFIVAFSVDPVGSATGGNWLASRPNLLPGDIMLTTKSGNYLALSSSGIVSIGSSPVAMRTYLPVQGLIRDHFLHYKATSPMGSTEWGSTAVLDGSEQFSVEQPHKAMLRHLVKSAIGDPIASVDVAIGSVDEETVDIAEDAHLLLGDNVNIPASSLGRLSIVVRSQDGASLYRMLITAEGEVLTRASTFDAEYRDKAHVVLGGTGTLEFGSGELVVNPLDSSIQLAVQSALVSVLGALSLTAGSISGTIGGVSVAAETGEVRLGEVPNSVVVDSGLLLSLLATHTHPVHTHPVEGPLAVQSPQLVGIPTCVSPHLKA